MKPAINARWPLLALLCAWFMQGGCGVKGPPVPPAPPLPAVVDLAYRVADGQVSLRWQLSAPLAREAARQAAFVVRRSQTALDQSVCENCPQLFTTVGMMPYVDTADASHTLALAIETGYRYVFTVHLKVGRDVGPDSNPVAFDYRADDSTAPVEAP